ncbi:hypothetical protein VULLAG_LOCUS21848 [Vulpes lagopus]
MELPGGPRHGGHRPERGPAQSRWSLPPGLGGRTLPRPHLGPQLLASRPQRVQFCCFKVPGVRGGHGDPGNGTAHGSSHGKSPVEQAAGVLTGSQVRRYPRAVRGAPQGPDRAADSSRCWSLCRAVGSGPGVPGVRAGTPCTPRAPHPAAPADACLAHSWLSCSLWPPPSPLGTPPTPGPPSPGPLTPAPRTPVPRGRPRLTAVIASGKPSGMPTGPGTRG